MTVKIIVTDLDGTVIDSCEIDLGSHRYVNIKSSWQEDPRAEATLDTGEHN